jgi:hypothetical protein
LCILGHSLCNYFVDVHPIEYYLRFAIWNKLQESAARNQCVNLPNKLEHFQEMVRSVEMEQVSVVVFSKEQIHVFILQKVKRFLT